jgi:hypothetical protein
MILLDPQLKFDEATHRYYLGNVTLPSVTTVLAAAGLLDYGFLGDRREQYLERGRAVHLATQQYDDHIPTEESNNAEILGYLEAWRAFRRDYGFVPHLIEHRVFNRQYAYAGTLDRVGSIRGGAEIIVDIKSGVAPAAVRYQLAAYAGCLPHPRSRRRQCVELHQDGAYKVIPFETSDYQRDLNEFLEALNAYKARKEEA